MNSQANVANLNADQLDGKDFSDFGATQLFNNLGPLPIQKTYTSEGGTPVISASGSGFRGTGTSQKEGLIGMLVTVDGGTASHLVDVYANERNSHKAFVPGAMVVRDLPAGQHTIRLQEYTSTACNTANEDQEDYCTDTDHNDIFQVTVVEIPD